MTDASKYVWRPPVMVACTLRTSARMTASEIGTSILRRHRRMAANADSKNVCPAKRVAGMAIRADSQCNKVRVSSGMSVPNQTASDMSITPAVAMPATARAISRRLSGPAVGSASSPGSTAAAPYPSPTSVSVMRLGGRVPVHSMRNRPVERLSRATSTPGRCPSADSILDMHPAQLAPRTAMSSARRLPDTATKADGSCTAPSGEAGASPLGHPATRVLTGRSPAF